MPQPAQSSLPPAPQQPPLLSLPARVERARALAARPASPGISDPHTLDLEPWRHIGDPIAEALVTELRAQKRMGGDILANARALREQDHPAADAFFRDIEHVPDWADFDAMRSGAAMGRRNPVGMMFGIHGAMPMTYVFPSVAKVMARTGRLDRGGDFRRRYWETATGFVGALDVDGMRPGGPRWEVWVRIRLLHTMVRLGIWRGTTWDPQSGDPIDQLTTAGGVYVFGQYRVDVIRALGGTATDAEERSFNLMWRWVARILGVAPELLGATDTDQRVLDHRILAHCYTRGEDARQLTASMLTGLATIRALVLPRPLHAAVTHRVLRAGYALPTGTDAATDLGVHAPRWARTTLTALTTAHTAANQAFRIPALRRVADAHGQALLDTAVRRGLGGVDADYRTTMA